MHGAPSIPPQQLLEATVAGCRRCRLPRGRGSAHVLGAGDDGWGAAAQEEDGRGSAHVLGAGDDGWGAAAQEEDGRGSAH
eukprot:scaffold1196_cov65-Isochrysis_galbana.AAC.2